jgi:predicted PurR-regulated permease PerM
MKKLVIILAAIVLAISPIMAQDSQSFSDQMSALINNAKTAQDKMNADLAAAQAEQ